MPPNVFTRLPPPDYTSFSQFPPIEPDGEDLWRGRSDSLLFLKKMPVLGRRDNLQATAS
jgi:hypothetical protein